MVATGARAKRLRLPREDEFWSRSNSACAICDGASPLFKGQVLTVVGGGDTATEEAIYLTKYASHVHLLVRRDQLRASKAMQGRSPFPQPECFKVFNNPNIAVHFNTETVDGVSNPKGQMSGILIRRFDKGEESVLEAKGLSYGIGHSPSSKLLEGQVELDCAGYILVKESTAKTSVEGVFAAGDIQVAHNSFSQSSNNQKLENDLRFSFSGDKVCGIGPGVIVNLVCKVVSEVLQWTLSGNNGLNEESEHREHSKSAVLNLLYLELSKCLWVFSKA